MKRFLSLLLTIPLLALIFATANVTSAQAGDSAITGTKFAAEREYQPIKMCHNWVIDTYLDGCGTTAGNKAFIQDSVSGIYKCTKDFGLSICTGSTNVLNWNDTDGFYQPSGWNVATNVIGIPTGWKRYKANDGHWIKVRSCGCWKIIKRYPKG